MLTQLYRGFCFTILVLALRSAAATASIEAPLFAVDEVLDLALSVDFDTMCRPREVEDCQYAPTTLVYSAAQETPRSIPVQIQIRGGWRARKAHCNVPPLFVRFPAAETAGTPFAGQALLPLTTHCRSSRNVKAGGARGREYEQYVLKEYLGYRLFNGLSERSLGVRLARITYTNPVKASRSVTRYGFFTEHFDAMAARHQSDRLPHKSFDYRKIDLAAFDTVALFNFMIGNTDWSVVRQRNIVLTASGEGRQYPVPFDLDMAGLVNAEYAGVSPRLPFRDVRRRLYLGFCHPETNFAALFARFQAEKPAVLALTDGVPGMNRSSRKATRAYLKKFFAILESPRRRQHEIVEACQPWPPSPDDHTTPPD